MMMSSNLKYLFVGCVLLVAACSPTRIARIGPPLPPKPPTCDVEVLEDDAVPSKPYRDVGMVELTNCQDYRDPPCLNWLTKAVCELGGDVAYKPEDDNLDANTGTINFRLMVAAYVGDIRSDFGSNKVFDPTKCNPRCGEEEVCLDGKCQPKDCEAAAEALKKALEEGKEPDVDGKCVE